MGLVDKQGNNLKISTVRTTIFLYIPIVSSTKGLPSSTRGHGKQYTQYMFTIQYILIKIYAYCTLR